MGCVFYSYDKKLLFADFNDWLISYRLINTAHTLLIDFYYGHIKHATHFLHYFIVSNNDIQYILKTNTFKRLWRIYNSHKIILTFHIFLTQL